MEINGQKVTWEGKKMILQVAQENGIEIPHYCYHPGLSIVASCRICLGEVEAPDPKDPSKLVKMPKLVPLCQTPAGEGMRATTLSSKARANQQAVMEFLLINHPLDCPVCDQSGECYLQDYSYTYGRSESRFLEDKAKKPKKDVGEHILLYSDRCIMCTRCVRFTREITGTAELAVFGRGHKEEIDIFPGKPVNNPLAGNVVDICPVGALLDKDFLFTQRVWFLKSTPSISPMNAGGENIEIQHTGGRIYRIKPRFNKDVNKWWISDEARYGFDFVHAANRLCVPEQLPAGAAFGQRTELSWDEAYHKLTAHLREAVEKGGPGSVACILSAFDSTEDIFLQIKFVRSIDPQAWLVFPGVRVDGQDKVFKNPATGQVTFVLRAEKAPNRKGAEKMMAHFGGNVCGLGDLPSGKIAAAVFATDPVRPHNMDERIKACVNIPAIIRLGSRAAGLYDRAVLSLPTCTWAEKSGIFENIEGRIQPFQQAIPPLEDPRAAGRIFWDLLERPGRYTAQAARQLMADSGLSEYASIPEPKGTVKIEEMEFAAL
jgi:NADH-quinone oxidoreductase subunit G